MDLQLKGRTCLVTGASRGIGRAAASILAAEGARVAVAARRANLLEELADEIAAAGGERPLVVEADVMAGDAPERIREAVSEALGGVEILVNSAGGSRPMPWDSPDEAWEEAMTLNFTALRRLSTALLPPMLERKWGRIINITGSNEPREVNAANSAKAAVHAWAKGLSRTVGRDGVTVNCLSPGRLNTEQILERRHPDPDERKRFADREIPVGYFGEPEDMGYLVAFLASPLARYITGEVIHVDGGLHRFAH